MLGNRPHQRESVLSTVKTYAEAIEFLYSKGLTVISAQMLADELYPDSRRHNANGQVFNLSSAAAARILRKNQPKLVHEFKHAQWEIVPEWLQYHKQKQESIDKS